MYNKQEVAFKIKQVAKNKKITIKQLLEDCNLNVNYISQFSNGRDMIAGNLYLIANYLDVSRDYLLGRTDEPKLTFNNIGNNNKGNQAIHGNVTVSQPQETDNRDLQLLQMLQELSPVDYARVILFIEELKNKKV